MANEIETIHIIAARLRKRIEEKNIQSINEDDNFINDVSLLVNLITDCSTLSNE